MTNYRLGNVILVKIAFSGTEGYKRRPAVIISQNEFNESGVKLIVAAITSNIYPPYRFGDVLLQKWNSAGLLKPSAVRGVFSTVDKSDVVSFLGTLSDDDYKRVKREIANILGFIIPSEPSNQ